MHLPGGQVWTRERIIAAMSRNTRLVLLAALCLASALVGMELMATAVALPRIVVDLSDWSQLRLASWIVNGYLLAYIAAMPLAGRAAGPLRVTAAADRGAGPVRPRLCPGGGRRLAARAGPWPESSRDRLVAPILPLATAGASWMFSGAARPRALGAVSASNFLGMALGPFLGATILEHFDLGPALAGAGLAGTPPTTCLSRPGAGSSTWVRPPRSWRSPGAGRRSPAGIDSRSAATLMPWVGRS